MQASREHPLVSSPRRRKDRRTRSRWCARGRNAGENPDHPSHAFLSRASGCRFPAEITTDGYRFLRFGRRRATTLGGMIGMPAARESDGPRSNVEGREPSHGGVRTSFPFPMIIARVWLMEVNEDQDNVSIRRLRVDCRWPGIWLSSATRLLF